MSESLEEQLFDAARGGQAAKVTRLLAAGAEVNWGNPGWDMFTPLHWAALQGRSDCVRVLLAHPGCHVDARDMLRETPLMYAAVRNHLEVAALLLQAGADTQAVDEDGQTALDLAGIGPAKAEMRQLLTGEVPPSKYLRPEDMGTARGGDLGTARDWTKGDATASDWTDEEKRGLTESNSLRVIYMGDFMAGKTSLVRTIISGGSYMSQVEDRTVIAEINHWVPDPKQRKTFSMVDLGGHQSYLSSGHYFHTNSPNNVSTLCHDITNMDYLRSFLWIKSFMTRSPESHIIAALTQCDKLGQRERAVKLDNFLKEVSKYLGQEIESLEDTIALAQSSKVETFKNLKKKYEDFQKKLLLKEVIFCVSCQPGFEQSISRLTSYYIHLSERPENLVIMPEHWHTFHSIIGRMGVKINLIMLAKEIQTMALSETSRKSQKSKTSKAKASPSSFSQQEQEDTDIVQAQQYLKLGEATDTFLSVLQDYNLNQDNLDEQTMRCLQSFHKHGFVMYFTGTPQLRQYIFNNISTFVSILRCIFHHDLQEMLSFRKIPAEVRAKCYRNKEQLFARDLELLRNEGLLSQQLLTVLLQQGHCDIEASVITDLLVTLEVGFLVQPEGVNTVRVFIPYFIEKREISPSIQSQLNAIVQCSDSLLSMHCQVSGNLPTTYWSYLMVAFFKLLSSSKLTKKVWKFGLLAHLGKCNGKIFLSYNEKDTIDFYIKADISDISGHRLIWDYINRFSAENERLMDSWWPGLVTMKVIVCTHCTLSNLPPYKWDLDSILSEEEDLNLETFQCQKEPHKDLPVALIQPLLKDAAAAHEALRALIHFLQNSPQTHDKDEPSGGRRVYARQDRQGAVGGAPTPLGKKSPDSAEKTSPDSAHPRQRRIQQITDISENSLIRVARQIGHHWKDVGTSLGFTKAELETLEYDNTYSLTARITNMLIQWGQRQEGDLSDILNTLHTTFQKCGFEVECVQTIEKGKVQETAPDPKIIHQIKGMSDASLNTVAHQIGHHWKEVGYSLGFTKAQLETLQHDNTHSLIDLITNMLIQWRRRQDLSEDQMINTLYSTFRKCGFKVESDQTIEDEMQVDRIGVAKYKLKKAHARVVQTKMSPYAGGDQQNTEATKDSLEQMVKRAVQIEISPYKDYAFRLPQIRNHHQTLVDNLFVPDVLDYLVPYFSVDDYEAIKALESTPRNQARMFLYMVDKRGRTALDVLIQAVREIPHLRHLLVHLQHQEEDGAQRRN